MKRRVLSICVIANVLCICAMLAGSRSLAQVSNSCPFGPCVPSSETLVNLYWDSSVSQWDSHVGGTTSGLTAAQLDTFTSALVHSTYFSQLTQYHVDQVSMAPSITAADCLVTPSAATMPANVDAAINGGIDNLTKCLAQTNSTLRTAQAVIINVFLPPQVLNTMFCNPLQDGSHHTAEHVGSSISNRFSWTIIPTTAACTGSLFSVTVALTHEIVEAATDPNPHAWSGWKNINGPSEIGDFCENPLLTTPYTFAAAQQYWSNAANSCVSGFSTTTALSVSSTAVCGTGQKMTITLFGAFGPPPWDLALNPGRTIYLTAGISGGASWTAGNLLGAPPDTVSLANLSWARGAGPGGSDAIKINGFGGSYGTNGQIVRPGDAISVVVENPDNGVRTTANVVAPGAVAIHNFGGAPDLLAGAQGAITGIAVDAAGCGVENASLQLSTTGGSLSPITVTTNAGGAFSSIFTAPDIGGSVTVSLNGMASASATTHVHPRIDSLVQPRGAVVGGESTVLNGLGFDPSSQVMFNGSAANVTTVATDNTSVTVVTPASPLTPGPGPASVVATVNSVSSSPAEYDYLNTGVPVIEFVDASGLPQTSHTCNTGHIRVDIFNSDGTPRTGTVQLSASYPAFWVPLGPNFGRWRPSTSAALGALVTLFNGGPVTAVDATNPASQSTESFPVWPQDLCNLVKAVDKKVSQIVAYTAPLLFASSPNCEGQCGAQGSSVVYWGDAEDVARTQNYISIRGKSAADIKASYKVEAVSAGVRGRLIVDNPFVAVRSKAEGRAAFVGPMIEIQSTGSRGASVGKLAGCRLSFASPDTSGTYGIVHLRSVGGRQAWIEEVPARATSHRTTIEADAPSTGVYSLVRIVAAPR